GRNRVEIGSSSSPFPCALYLAIRYQPPETVLLCRFSALNCFVNRFLGKRLRIPLKLLKDSCPNPRFLQFPSPPLRRDDPGFGVECEDCFLEVGSIPLLREERSVSIRAPKDESCVYVPEDRRRAEDAIPAGTIDLH